MEEKAGIIGKRIWNVVRAIFFMVRRGISRGKLVVELNLMLKRGKKLVFQRHAVSAAAHSHYEFSCSNTPSFSFSSTSSNKKKKKKKKHIYYPPALEDDQLLDLFNSTAPSPYLPGFAPTPLLIKPLRITDSPFPLDDDDPGDNGFVDKAAEDFIQRFYKDLKNQRITVSPSSSIL